ncbi:MAG: TetR/AcrR family transcriptional regulator [Clostridia bacterium]|nr:TetR/AcrR family transcriptional regulator [Clostridia bacterium]
MLENTERRAEDRRVKRTKKALRDCLFRLLEEKSADEITVKELTALADINRSTFYFYYKDIDDMLIRIQDEIYAVFERDVIETAGELTGASDFIRYLTRFLLFCKEHEKICKFVVGNDPKNNLAKRLRTSLLRCIPDTTQLFPAEDPRRYLTDYAIAGFWQLIVQWMYDGMRIPPREMAAFLTNIYFYGSRHILQQGWNEQVL